MKYFDFGVYEKWFVSPEYKLPIGTNAKSHTNMPCYFGVDRIKCTRILYLSSKYIHDI